MSIVIGGVALAALLALLVWAAGSLVARVVGALLVIDGLLSLSQALVRPADALPRAIAWLAVGVLLWLVGHRLYLAKYGRFRSALARQAFSAPLLRLSVPGSRGSTIQ